MRRKVIESGANGNCKSNMNAKLGHVSMEMEIVSVSSEVTSDLFSVDDTRKQFK